MKILMLTQKVDAGDDLLGVYHGWIRELSKKVEKINVICLYRGNHDLPSNVSIYSLGKEENRSKIKYLKRFFYYIWTLRRDYDIVFVHMNKEYVILGSIFWRCLSKKIVFWYAHYLIDWQVRISVWLSDKVITSSRFACKIKSRKLIVVGQGVDTEHFKNLNIESDKEKTSILFLGRISPVKNLETLIKALAIIKEKDDRIFLNVVGAPTEKDKNYLFKIKQLINDLGLFGYVKLWDKVSYLETLEFYNKNNIFINLTPTGSFDKTILEAMACERLVLVSNKAFLEIIPENYHNLLIFKENEEKDLAEKINKLINLNNEEKQRIGKEMREIVAKNHGLGRLMENISSIFYSLK